MEIVTVVMSTYNGEKYIRGQLQSLLDQEKTIDEVIICDDHSNDHTINIVKDFISSNSLSDTWKLQVNEKNLGWKKNFNDLLRLAKGEYIFLCDQDDVWLPDKTKNMVEIMKKNKKIEVLLSNYIPKYEGNAPKRKEKMVNDNSVNKIEFGNHFMDVIRPGCTYCTRKRIINELQFFDDGKFPHDALLCRLSSIRDTLYLYNKETIIFRRHSDNTSTQAKTFNWRLETFKEKKELCDQFKNYYINILKNEETDPKAILIENMRIYYLNLVVSYEQRKLVLLLKNLFKFYSFYPSPQSALLDFIMVFKEKF